MPPTQRHRSRTATEQGTVYLICFARPIGNLANPHGQARHYPGWCKNLSQRLTEHRTGHGARILRYLMQIEVGWSCVRTWPGTLADEARLKGRHRHADLCPCCNHRMAAHRYVADHTLP